jgi:hypothetical protein
VYSPEDTLVEVEGRFPQSRDLLRERAREPIEN